MATIGHPTALGTYWLTGSREPRWQTARFTLMLDMDVCGKDVPLPILENADWPTTWKALVARFKANRVEGMMRETLPGIS